MIELGLQRALLGVKRFQFVEGAMKLQFQPCDPNLELDGFRRGKG